MLQQYGVALLVAGIAVLLWPVGMVSVLNGTIDDGNPGLFESTRWYGIQLPDGRFGYISEVWIRDADRGGLDLPHC